MSVEIEQEHRNEENYTPDPIFFRKKRLTEEMKQELESLKSAFDDQKSKIKYLWQATVKVVKERKETNLALKKSLLLKQNQESEASTSNASKENENTASRVEFEPEMGDQAVEFYRMWIGELKKNASRQREVVRDSVGKWFHFLHRFDDEELQPKESVSSESPMRPHLYYLSVIILFAACVLFIFKDQDLLNCNDEPLVCLHEIIVTLAFRIRNFYFKFHGITDYSNVSNISHLSKVASSAYDS